MPRRPRPHHRVDPPGVSRSGHVDRVQLGQAEPTGRESSNRRPPRCRRRSHKPMSEQPGTSFTLQSGHVLYTDRRFRRAQQYCGAGPEAVVQEDASKVSSSWRCGRYGQPARGAAHRPAETEGCPRAVDKLRHRLHCQGLCRLVHRPVPSIARSYHVFSPKRWAFGLRGHCRA